MQRGAAPIAIIVIILATIAAAGYFLLIGHKEQKTLNFDKYQLILPPGYQWTGVVSSEIDSAFGVCNFNPESLSQTETPCKYVVIKRLDDNETQIIIADTPKWGLGGGGYITTVNEKIDLGPKGYEAEFSSIWIAGEVDSNGEPTGKKLTLDNGNPVLYYVTGCLRPNLCIHINAKQSEDGSYAYPDNSWQFDQFKQFVNFLKISTTGYD